MPVTPKTVLRVTGGNAKRHWNVVTDEEQPFKARGMYVAFGVAEVEPRHHWLSYRNGLVFDPADHGLLTPREASTRYRDQILFWVDLSFLAP